MTQRTIRYHIWPNGHVEESVEGVEGLDCEQLTKQIEARLGRIQHRRRTAEAYQSSPLQDIIQQPLSQSLT